MNDNGEKVMGLASLIAQAESCLENETTPIEIQQVIAKIFTEINLSQELLASLPYHLRREYERLEDEIAEKKERGDTMGMLATAIEILRIMTAALSQQKTLQKGREI